MALSITGRVKYLLHYKSLVTFEGQQLKLCKTTWWASAPRRKIFVCRHIVRWHY